MTMKTMRFLLAAALVSMPGVALAKEACRAQTVFAVVVHGGALSEKMECSARLALKPLEVEAGLIGIDRKGNVGMYWNTVGMFRGYATDMEVPVVAEYEGPTSSKPRPKP